MSRAFTSVPQTHRVVAFSSSLYSTAAESAPETAVAPKTSAFELPPRVVFDELPIVYVYDHCPFCVRVRIALGLKNIKHNIVFLANDDIPTPTALVGKKIAPIFVSFHCIV